jgi:hypothetical protein
MPTKETLRLLMAVQKIVAEAVNKITGDGNE